MFSLFIFVLVQKGPCLIDHLIPEKEEQTAFEQEHACYDRLPEVGKNAKRQNSNPLEQLPVCSGYVRVLNSIPIVTVFSFL